MKLNPKHAGILTTLAGLGLMFLTSLLEERKTKQYIKEEVDHALAERAKEES